MKKKIVLETCKGCPHFDHSGSFTRGGPIPLCMKADPPKNENYGGRRLPVTAAINERTGYPIRVWTYKIPSWCPLGNDE